MSFSKFTKMCHHFHYGPILAHFHTPSRSRVSPPLKSPLPQFPALKIALAASGVSDKWAPTVVVLCVQLLSSNTMFLRLAHVVAGIRSVLWLDKHSTGWLYHTLFIYLPTDDHFHRSHFMSITFFFSFGKHLGVRRLGYMVNVNLTFKKLLFSKVIIPSYIPTSNMWKF